VGPAANNQAASRQFVLLDALPELALEHRSLAWCTWVLQYKLSVFLIYIVEFTERSGAAVVQDQDLRH